MKMVASILRCVLGTSGCRLFSKTTGMRIIISLGACPILRRGAHGVVPITNNYGLPQLALGVATAGKHNLDLVWSSESVLPRMIIAWIWRADLNFSLAKFSPYFHLPHCRPRSHSDMRAVMKDSLGCRSLLPHVRDGLRGSALLLRRGD